MSASTDTIVALATPPGRGGVAIVRVSGSKVLSIASALLKKTLTPRVATFLPFYDADHQVLDEGIALYFESPHSFTGEAVLELQGHGGPIVVDLIIARIVALGARLARPGEFSERAFLNDKLDLTQVEAIADLIDASSREAARLAIRSLQGEFSALMDELSGKIIYLRMYIEAAIDFTEEEIDFLSDEKVSQGMTDLIARISAIQATAKQGSLLREGVSVVIVGRPNVGKSSLLNRLSGKEIAIVTDIPGTTRDVLRDEIIMDGIPLHIIDTAGLRDSDDPIEQEGIRRAHLEIEKADLILCLGEVSHEPDLSTFKMGQASFIDVRNKIDLTGESPAIVYQADHPTVYISAKENRGIDLLKQVMKERVGYLNTTEGVFLARRRHLEALATAQSHLQSAAHELSTTKLLELVAEELRLAQLAINSITGEFTTDDLLGEIFSSFCVGK